MQAAFLTGGRRCRGLAAAVLWPVALLVLPAAEAGASDARCTVLRIEWERDAPGRSQGLLWSIERDGLLRRSATGKPRLGTADQHDETTLPRAEFDRVAAALLAQGAPALAGVHDDEALADGGWARLALDCADGRRIEVWRREGAGPAALDRLQARVEAELARLAPRLP